MDGLFWVLASLWLTWPPSSSSFTAVTHPCCGLQFPTSTHKRTTTQRLRSSISIFQLSCHLPIHGNSGCDTSWLLIGWWFCFLRVVRGLLLDHSWYPQSSGQNLLLHNPLQALRPLLNEVPHLSDQDFFHFMSPYPFTMSTCAFWNHHNPEGELEEWCKRSFLDQAKFCRIQPNISCLIIEMFPHLQRTVLEVLLHFIKSRLVHVHVLKNSLVNSMEDSRKIWHNKQ